VSRARLNVFLEAEHAERLAELSVFKGVSKSGLIATALDAWFSPEGLDMREAAIARRLDKLTDLFERLERDQTVLIETVAVFIRYTLAVNAPIPESHQESARAQGRVRFAQFIEQLARRLQKGGSLVKDVHREIYPDQRQFFDEPEEAAAPPAAAREVRS
jgi:hypothetical protein